MPNLEKVEGIGAKGAAKLTKAGVKTTDALLREGATAKGRKELAKKSGLSEKRILTWVNHCDLFRISGVGEEYSRLRVRV